MDAPFCEGSLTGGCPDNKVSTSRGETQLSRLPV